MSTHEDGDFRFKGAAMLVFKALQDLKLGDYCWCDVAIGNPMMRNHSPQCLNAKRAVEAFKEAVLVGPRLS